ncbi:hypothetical protein ACFQYP_22240 [Nonomuraea antimicrobica]|uniref:hypothetical protein n=1 Tax=Nonomuraea antimicrobica TaxID=561173 RepID=UPI0031E6DA3D
MLLDEMELYGRLLAAVATFDRPLTEAEIDEVLDLGPEPARSGPQARVLASVRAGTDVGRRPGSRTERRTPGFVVRRDTTPVSPAQVYRQARQQAAADEPAHDVGAGLARLVQWMTHDSDDNPARSP